MIWFPPVYFIRVFVIRSAIYHEVVADSFFLGDINLHCIWIYLDRMTIIMERLKFYPTLSTHHPLILPECKLF